ncbi:alpha/beta fold hydrolase [Cyanobacteria bacterium FACHB-DQ100]|nr:alpha/beta fold hydrolase [Cyanobacteria bacterium FACHB-DQ100]
MSRIGLFRGTQTGNTQTIAEAIQLDVLWLSSSPSLKIFDRALLQELSQQVRIGLWEYQQTQDEASCLDRAVELLHEYLQTFDRSIHLAGHGMGGVIGLTYARRHPEKVRSLTLLAVGAQPATTWQAYYYIQRRMLPYSQTQILAQSVRSLFGNHLPYPLKHMVTLFARDLDESPSIHSLFKLSTLPRGGVSVPLMICGSKTDPLISLPNLYEWIDEFKPGDMIWTAPIGSHFFHHCQAQATSQEIQKFWRCVGARLQAMERKVAVRST